MTDCFVANLGAVAHETFDDETVLIHLERGSYFSLRQSAPAIWAMIQSPATLDAMLAALADSCGVLPPEAPDAVAAMLEQLCAEGCVLRIGHPGDVSAPRVTTSPAPFALPVVESFHDLAELISIDPVHDAHELQGWPHRPQAGAAD